MVPLQLISLVLVLLTALNDLVFDNRPGLLHWDIFHRLLDSDGGDHVPGLMGSVVCSTGILSSLDVLVSSGVVGKIGSFFEPGEIVFPDIPLHDMIPYGPQHNGTSYYKTYCSDFYPSTVFQPVESSSQFVVLDSDRNHTAPSDEETEIENPDESDDQETETNYLAKCDEYENWRLWVCWYVISELDKVKNSVEVKTDGGDNISSEAFDKLLGCYGPGNDALVQCAYETLSTVVEYRWSNWTRRDTLEHGRRFVKRLTSWMNICEDIVVLIVSNIAAILSTLFTFFYVYLITVMSDRFRDTETVGTPEINQEANEAMDEPSEQSSLNSSQEISPPPSDAPSIDSPGLSVGIQLSKSLSDFAEYLDMILTSSGDEDNFEPFSADETKHIDIELFQSDATPETNLDEDDEQGPSFDQDVNHSSGNVSQTFLDLYLMEDYPALDYLVDARKSPSGEELLLNATELDQRIGDVSAAPEPVDALQAIDLKSHADIGTIEATELLESVDTTVLPQHEDNCDAPQSPKVLPADCPSSSSILEFGVATTAMRLSEKLAPSTPIFSSDPKVPATSNVEGDTSRSGDYGEGFTHESGSGEGPVWRKKRQHRSGKTVRWNREVQRLSRIDI